MPNVTVYIRVDDMDAWKALPNKARAVASLLKQNSKITSYVEKKADSRANVELPTTIKKQGQFSRDIRTCPHGYGIGMCKHASCNKKLIN